MPQSSIHFMVKVLPWDFLNGLLYVPKGIKTPKAVKMGINICLIEKIMEPFGKAFPLVAFPKLDQFNVKT